MRLAIRPTPSSILFGIHFPRALRSYLDQGRVSQEKTTHELSELDLSTITFAVAVALCILTFSACEYQVPITSTPTRKVEERLLGDWTSSDGKEKIKVRRLDATIYIIYYDGDLFRAYHSDVAETSFVSVQDINSADRKYAYVVWKLSNDGKGLSLRSVNSKVIPKETKDSARVEELLKKNLQNPKLLGETIQFTKEK